MKSSQSNVVTSDELAATRGWGSVTTSRVAGPHNVWDLCPSCCIAVEAWITHGDGPADKGQPSPSPTAPAGPTTSVIVKIDGTRLAEIGALPGVLEGIRKGQA